MKQIKMLLLFAIVATPCLVEAWLKAEREEIAGVATKTTPTPIVEPTPEQAAAIADAIAAASTPQAKEAMLMPGDEGFRAAVTKRYDDTTPKNEISLQKNGNKNKSYQKITSAKFAGYHFNVEGTDSFKEGGLDLTCSRYGKRKHINESGFGNSYGGTFVSDRLSRIKDNDEDPIQLIAEMYYLFLFQNLSSKNDSDTKSFLEKAESISKQAEEYKRNMTIIYAAMKRLLESIKGADSENRVVTKPEYTSIKAKYFVD